MSTLCSIPVEGRGWTCEGDRQRSGVKAKGDFVTCIIVCVLLHRQKLLQHMTINNNVPSVL